MKINEFTPIKKNSITIKITFNGQFVFMIVKKKKKMYKIKIIKCNEHILIIWYQLF